ncbi:L-histidine N(alpha)-methyltransferase [Granulicella tundricola]|uniref:Methyltransferase n=1 Tax=Granulicella tundricola (strain ATCC BAA-1859 / DSM 23138 / MP5ACTX9) TaxID=1198114 RepID=E8X132_GRATM|nr:L-histidine N(alpha)-methyltransferase [Granulicella tundricola]ADW67898.1 methyltransferase [Granulicella tundricola MP5ACTX9]
MPTQELIASNPVSEAAREGLLAARKTLPPWLFYDERGSRLFEQITLLPEYYLTRTERAILATHAPEIVSSLGAPITLAELGAGTATKTGLLLAAAARIQPTVLYQPIDVSPSALDEAVHNLQRDIPGVNVRPQVANYITEPIRITRPTKHTRILALYIGSSIGNFSPAEARGILLNLRAQLAPGDALLLGTDLAPGPNKSEAALIAAYDDAQGVTAAFNRNILTHLNRELGTNFIPGCFHHRALWNPTESRMEMHLESKRPQSVTIPADPSGPAQTIHFERGETIHTENSHKFTPATIASLLATANFTPTHTYHDPNHLFAVTLATAI